jgi:hypothetical protein
VAGEGMKKIIIALWMAAVLAAYLLIFVGPKLEGVKLS